MNILVSGGTGLVGRYVVDGLLTAGHAVSVGARNRPADTLFAAPVSFLPLALSPEHDQSAVFAGIEAFVHLAFDHEPGRYRGGEGTDPQKFRRLNLDGSVQLFEQAKDSGVTRCIFLSSRAVYDGLPPGTVLREDLSLAPDSLYGRIKLEAEQALAAMSSPKFTTASLRATGVYGDYRPNKWDRLFEDFCAQRPVSSRTGSEVHGADVSAAIHLLLEAEKDAVSGQSFNVSDIVTDTHKILKLYADATGQQHPLPAIADRSAVNVMDTSQLRSLGWRPGGMPLLERTVTTLARAGQKD